MSIDNEWLLFKEQVNTGLILQKETKKKNVLNNIPKCSEIYISTQTKIAYLNQPINLNNIFWRLPVINYYLPKNGIIKKSIKINSNTEEQLNKLDKKISEQDNIFITQISKIKTANKFKDVKKIDIGLCEKDIISYRKKKKGAFYNCFAVILRIFYKEKFREVHVKIFNTGKLEIPGIQFDELLTITLDTLVKIMQPILENKLSYNKDGIDTVLINSNFSCGYFLDRYKLFQKLKYTYNILASYDPCSYPGIQCLFWYNKYNTQHDGIYNENDEKMIEKYDDYNEKWQKISFMVFRTGSVLIVGNCNKYILNVVYEFIKEILFKEFSHIYLSVNDTKKKKPKKKIRKKMLKILI